MYLRTYQYNVKTSQNTVLGCFLTIIIVDQMSSIYNLNRTFLLFKKCSHYPKI